MDGQWDQENVWHESRRTWWTKGRLWSVNKPIEKFTSADIFADGKNDTIVDEGYFTLNGFHLTLLVSGQDADCDCGDRKEHEQHLLIMII